MAGQQFVPALADHPWFKIRRLAASPRSAGKTYRQALTDEKTGALRWSAGEEPSDEIWEMTVEDARELDLSDIDIVFTAVESDAARQLEPQYARHKPVLSTASAHRYDEDVPIMVAGVNPAHAEMIRVQKEKRGWQGFVAPIPNCTVTGLAMTLKPIADRFGLRKVIVTSLQSVSGAGRSPGVLMMDLLDNVIPFIPQEEEKVEREGQKILGRLEGGRIVPLDIPVSATCTRVPVLDGHTEAVTVSTERPCTPEEAAEAMSQFGEEYTSLGLPSAPKRLIHVLDDPYRPQPRLDREREAGMATTVGRVRKDHVLENGIKYVLVTHNTKMGAAKGAVLNAEFLVKKGYIG